MNWTRRLKYLATSLLPIRIRTPHHTVSSAQVDTDVNEHCTANFHQARMTSSVLAAFLLPLVVSTMAVDLPYFCGFEDPGLCGMEHRDGGYFNWTRYNQSTPSDGTGPEKAVEGDWYMYIETSAGAPDYVVKGDEAYIQTPAIEYTGDLCIRFQYHMNGHHIGRLVVFLDARGENSTAAFTKSGDQHTEWHRATVKVEGFKTGTRVVFMAEVGSGFQGDIALDELHIADGTCNDCQINNGGCQHICLPQGNWPICSCHDGYIKDGHRCIAASTTSTPATTSTSSPTKTQDTPVWTNPVLSTTSTTPPQSSTTLMATGQQTGVTTGLQDQLDDCAEAYSKVVVADQAFESSCKTDVLLFNEPRDQCLREACRRGVEVVAVRNEVCDLKLCHDGDIQLAASAGSLGWDIFVLNRTWGESLDDQPSAEQGHSDVPLWQVIIAVTVVVLVVIVSAFGIAVYLKRRKMVSQATEPDRVYYENDAALPTRTAGDVTKPTDEAPYEDIDGPRPATASAVQIQMSPPRSDHGDPNPGGYEDLEPYEPRVAGPYDVIP